MTIKRIEVENFRSFRHVDVDLRDFNVVIGGNASGKSNFTRLFEFLRDTRKHGLDNAISLQGGVEYFRNLNIGAQEDFAVDLLTTVEREESNIYSTSRNEEQLIGIRPYEVAYRLVIRFHRKGLGFEVAEEHITQKCELLRFSLEDKRSIKERGSIGRGEIAVSNIGGDLNVDLKLPQEASIEADEIVPRFYRQRKMASRSLLQEAHIFAMPDLFDDISIFDFDPKLPKRAAPISGKAELEQDGSNLAIVLEKIIGDSEKFRKFSNLMKDLLPYVVDIDTERYADKSLLFTVKESYSGKKYLPAPIISDGTINITALVVALYFEKKPVTIIEEPERNMHPFLVSKVVEMMRDVSRKKQIIATTHNPEFVKHAKLNSLLLVTRDKEGFSTVARPANTTSVRAFLENEMGIDELYVQNLLGLET